MTPQPNADILLDMPLDCTRRRAVDFFELTKPRVILMVLVTTAIGFYLGAQGAPDYLVLLHTLIGTALAGGGTLALNQFMEREADGKMQRTRLRPLPNGRLQAREALMFGMLIMLGGLAYLWWVVSGLSALVTASIVVSYLFAYTPLKQRTSLCSIVGAVPGALPPVIGWAAARDTLGLEAWILFTIMFLWQMPHSLAIGWLYRDDYAKAGFRLLPVIDTDGRVTGRQIVLNCAALLAVGLLPTLIGFAGATYFFAALVLGSVFLWYGLRLATLRSLASARHLLFASLIYLPVLLAVLAFDKVTFYHGAASHLSAHAVALHGPHADHVLPMK
jgi:protoheme IX farnesyltransferase